MTEQEKPPRPGKIRRWCKKTSNRTFIVYPVLIIVVELVLRWGDLRIVIWGIPLMAWGYLQFRYAGVYRTRRGGGGPGFDIPPERIVDTGIYAWTRNPMYLGHFIYLTGAAILFWSLPAVILILCLTGWYQRRVREDESRLTEMFGGEYGTYMLRVRRWVPGLF